MGYSQASSINNFTENGPTLSSYEAWLKKHPSALESFERIMKPARGKNMVVFLDYDGTLSPIVDDPDQAFMSQKMRSAVQEVAQVFPTAIISGRCRNKVKEFVKLENVTYAGSHGMDILTTLCSFNNCNHQNECRVRDVHDEDNQIYFQPAKNFLPAIKEIMKVLEEKIKGIKGATLEDNKFCISVHFRRVNVEDVDSLKDLVKSVMENYPSFHITGGRKVIAEDMGRGYPIIVSSIPKETKATYSLRDTNEVMSFLLRLVKWRSTCFSSCD